MAKVVEIQDHGAGLGRDDCAVDARADRDFDCLGAQSVIGTNSGAPPIGILEIADKGRHDRRVPLALAKA